MDPSGLGPGFFNLSNVLVPQNVALIVVAWSLTELISRASKGLPFVQERMLPVLPVLFCVAFVFATSSWQPSATYGERMLLGSLLGTVTVWGHMTAQATGLHRLMPFMRAGKNGAADDDPKKSTTPKKDA